MCVEERFTVRYIIAHEESRDFGCHTRILYLNLLKQSSFGIECGLPQLFRIHLTETFVSLKRERSLMNLAVFFQSHIIIEVLLFASGRNCLVQRRHGYIYMAFIDEFRHESVEKGKEQRCDMRTVDIGIGHDNDLVIAKPGDIEVVAVTF